MDPYLLNPLDWSYDYLHRRTKRGSTTAGQPSGYDGLPLPTGVRGDEILLSKLIDTICGTYALGNGPCGWDNSKPDPKPIEQTGYLSSTPKKQGQGDLGPQEHQQDHWGSPSASHAAVSPAVGSSTSGAKDGTSVGGDPNETEFNSRVGRLDKDHQSLIRYHSGGSPQQKRQVLDFVEGYIAHHPGDTPLRVERKTSPSGKQRLNAAPKQVGCALCGFTSKTIQKAAAHLLATHLNRISLDNSSGFFGCEVPRW
ncbi:hypothetical protein FRC17_006687 [Serendipita sp. 399]|nr:hypothetical protein FRC17_006687 [Serendipita sp. 399]